MALGQSLESVVGEFKSACDGVIMTPRHLHTPCPSVDFGFSALRKRYQCPAFSFQWLPRLRRGINAVADALNLGLT